MLNEYEVWHNGFVKAGWNFDYLDFDRDEVDFFIDRDVHDLDIRFRQILSPVLRGYVGYRYRDVAFDEFDIKDSESHIFFGGGEFKLAGCVNFFGEVGYEEREFVDNRDLIGPFLGIPVAGISQRLKQNVNYRVGLETTFSRYSSLTAFYDDHLYESSRSEFTVFRGKTVGVTLKQYLSPETVAFLSYSSQFQEFDTDDSTLLFIFFFPNRDTEVHSVNATLRRMLKPWLYLDVGYSYLKRVTDFPGEDSESHRIRAGVIASF